jgi:hypothetical protein
MSIVIDAGEALVLGGLTYGALELPRRAERARVVALGPRSSGRSSLRAGLLGALVGALVLGLGTGWIAGACWGAVGGWAAVVLGRRDRALKARIERLDARASWVGLVRGQVVGGRALAEALANATDGAPAAIASECAVLRAVPPGTPTAEALSTWRERLDDPDAIQLATVMALAASGAAAKLSLVLGQLARQLRARAASERRVERERHRLRIAGRIVAGVSVVLLIGGARLDHRLFGFYGSPAGQVALTAVLGVQALGLWLLARIDKGVA